MSFQSRSRPVPTHNLFFHPDPARSRLINFFQSRSRPIPRSGYPDPDSGSRIIPFFNKIYVLLLYKPKGWLTSNRSFFLELPQIGCKSTKSAQNRQFCQDCQDPYRYLSKCTEALNANQHKATNP
jgi:hypothetical protein